MAGIIPAAGTTDTPSYHGYNGTMSKIDYVMMHEESCRVFGISQDNLRIICQPCKEDDPSIISTHDPIYFELTIHGKPEMLCDGGPLFESIPVINRRLLWENADIDLYQSSLETLLHQNFEFWNEPECLNTLALLIPEAYKQAAEIAVPSKQQKDMGFKTLK